MATISNDFIVKSGLLVQGTTAVSSSTGQVGATQLNGGLAVAKNLIVATTATVWGNTDLKGTLDVGGLTTLGGGLNVTGDVVFNNGLATTGTLHVYGDAIVDQNLIVKQNGEIQGVFTVTGATTLTGLATLLGGATVNNGVTVNGDTTFNGSVFVTSTNSLNVGSGVTNLGGALNVAGVAAVTNNTAATSGGSGALTVTGGAYINNNLIVNSTAYDTSTKYSNALYVNGGAWIDQGLIVDGPTTFNDIVIFNGTATYVLSTNTVYTDNLLNLHTPPEGIGTPWTFDDGKDIGLIFHYYKGADKTGFLGFANDSGYLEWYNDGTESGGVFTGTSYGTFKTGDIQLVGTTNASNTTSGALQVAGGVGVGRAIYAGENISGATVNARNLTQDRLVLAGASGQLTDSSSLTWNSGAAQIEGRIAYANTATLANQATLATSADNLTGGDAGSIPYQTTTGTTSFISIGQNGYVLTSNGTTPGWGPVSGLSAGNATTATNIAGGLADQIPYQSAPGITTFNNGLRFNGTTFTTTNVVVTDTADTENNSTSGALQVAGGVSIAKSLYVANSATIGGSLYVDGDIFLQGAGLNTVNAQTGTFETLFVTGTNGIVFDVSGDTKLNQGLRVTGQSTFTGKISVLDSTNAANTTSGSIVTAGGLGVGQDVRAGGTVYAGTSVAGTVVPGFFSNNVLMSSYTSNAISGTGQVNLDTWDSATYRTVRYLIQIVDGTNIHVTEMTLFHDGTDIFKNEYGVSTSDGELGTFDATLNLGTVTLKFTPTGATAMTIKVVRTAITA